MSHALSYSKMISKRLGWIYVITVVFSFMILSRAGWLQLRSDHRFEKMAQRQFQSKVQLKPRRGSILDRNGETLAVNVETYSLAVDPSKFKNRANLETMARLLGKALGQDSKRLIRKFSQKKEFVWIQRSMSEKDLSRLKSWNVYDGYSMSDPALILIKESQRAYPHGKLAGSILGSVNIDSEGLEGLEYYYNDFLKGKVASVRAIRDALGRFSTIDSQAIQEVQDGETLRLTLDSALQFSVEHAVKEAVERTNARNGMAIVMNVDSGEIFAMAMTQSNDPNGFRKNRAVTDGYEPGSTFKPILLAAALEKGFHLTDSMWCENGKYKIQGRTISEAETHEKFKWLTLKQIIKHSSNIGSAKLALKLGAETYIGMMKKFGFGEKTEINFPGEYSGKLPNAKTVSPLTLANNGFGQGLLVTPIQMVKAYAAFFNGGWSVQPTLIPGVQKRQRIMTEDVAAKIVEALSAVTETGGSGVKANLEGYKVAGKTGTAQVVDPTLRTYSRTHYFASFIGAPLEVNQKFVIFAALDEPRGVYYAAETAAPLFKNVLSAVVNRFSIPSNPNYKQTEEPQVLAQHKPSIVDRLESAQASVLHFEGANALGRLTWKMPDLSGLTLRESFQVLKGKRFQVEVKGNGLIKDQYPKPGETLVEDTTVRLVLVQ